MINVFKRLNTTWNKRNEREKGDEDRRGGSQGRWQKEGNEIREEEEEEEEGAGRGD